MPFLKSLTFGKSRHKKLPEEWGSSIKQPVNDGMSFYVKYLGSTLVDKPSDESITAEAIKSIIAMAKLSGKKLKRVTLTVKPTGLQVTDVSNGNIDIDVSIYRISYCSADATFDRVVAFIATNKNETLECHAFLTSKRKIAQAAALTISQAFTIAFEKWQESKSKSKQPDVNSNNGVKSNEASLIDLSFDPQHVVSIKSQSPELIQKLNLPSNGIPSSKGTSSVNKSPNNFAQRFDEDEDLDDSFFMLAKSRAESKVNGGLLPNNVTKSDFDSEDLSSYLSSQDKNFGKDDIFFSSDSPDDLFNL